MKKYQLHSFFNQHGQIILLLIWILTVSIHLIFIGVFTDLEAEKYIYEARRLLQHKALSASRFIFYSPTILIIFFSLKINAGFYGAFFIQAIYNLGVTLFFYRSLRSYFYNYAYSFLTTFILITFSPYSVWTVYLYTESVFYTNILLLISFIIIHSTSNTKKNKVLVLLALILVILSRPMGILFILPVFFYFYNNSDKRYKVIFIIGFFISILLVFNVSNIVFSTIEDVNITLAASQGCVICGIIPEHAQQVSLSNKGSQIYQLYYYIINNFDHFARLGIIKCGYFFMMVRGYYSLFHNGSLLLFIIPLYTLSFVYIFARKHKSYQSFFFFQISSIAFFTIAVMVQCDDYHNRFILSLFPLILLLAIKGLEKLLSKYHKNETTPSSPS